MRFNGSIDLAGNEARRMNVEQVNNFPADATPGRVIFKEGRVLACVEISGGLPVWVPLTNSMSALVFDQETLSNTWTITHQFNSAVTMVQVLDENNRVIIPDDINLSVKNQVTVSFSIAVRGKVIVMLGDIEGTAKPNVAYEQDFASSTSWVINHGLGYEPIIRVFVGNQEVQPQSITHNSTIQATVTFSTAQAGRIKAI